MFLALSASVATAQQPSERRARPNYSVRSVRENLRIAQQLNAAAEAETPTPQSPVDRAELPEMRSQTDQSAPATETDPSESATPREYRVPLRTPNLENVRLKAEDGLVSLVAREGSLADVITLLAETQGLNVVTADPLSIPVSITLDRVKLEDALDAVLSIAGYTWSINKNIMFITNIANSGILSPQTQGVRLEVITLDYAMAQDVNTTITGMLSPLGSSFIMTSTQDDSRRSREVVAVQDLPSYLERIREYVAQVDIPPRQVLIEVHVLQVDLDSTNRNGVNLDQLFRRNGNMLFELHTTGLASATPSQAFTFRFSDGNLGAFLEMLRTTTDAKTLASPRILALSGQQSRIQVGEQLGFRVTTTTETSTTQSVDFLDVGVVLEVTPRISREGRIMLSVRPEVSSGRVNPDTGLPEEKTTELDTDVLLCDNEGIIIGGLIQETDTDLQQKLPWLGSLRYVGGLFRRKETTKNRKEIIMALVPRLVPYRPIYDQYAQEKFLQADTPLFVGPLERTLRPWEPRLPEHSVIPGGYDVNWWQQGGTNGTSIDTYFPDDDPYRETHSESIAPSPEGNHDCEEVPVTPAQSGTPAAEEPQVQQAPVESKTPVEATEPTGASSNGDPQHTDPPPVHISRLPAVPSVDEKSKETTRRLPPISSDKTITASRLITGRVIGLR